MEPALFPAEDEDTAAAAVSKATQDKLLAENTARAKAVEHELAMEKAAAASAAAENSAANKASVLVGSLVEICADWNLIGTYQSSDRSFHFHSRFAIH